MWVVTYKLGRDMSVRRLDRLLIYRIFGCDLIPILLYRKDSVSLVI